MNQDGKSFISLTDYDRARTDYHNSFDILFEWHIIIPRSSNYWVSVAICVTAFILLKRKSRVAQTA